MKLYFAALLLLTFYNQSILCMQRTRTTVQKILQQQKRLSHASNSATCLGYSNPSKTLRDKYRNLPSVNKDASVELQFKKRID